MDLFLYSQLTRIRLRTERCAPLLTGWTELLLDHGLLLEARTQLRIGGLDNAGAALQRHIWRHIVQQRIVVRYACNVQTHKYRW